jgi:DNA-binding GntR family transcriptional regulator
MTTRSKDEPATTKPAVDCVVEQIAELIISGEYKPGQRITELPLARRLVRHGQQDDDQKRAGTLS